MADDDEIDILGDFSFDSCLAQNNQGIPSCSNREDTVHPQWLLDSTETNNWYDKQSKDSLQSLRNFSGPARKLLGDHSLRKFSEPHTVWSQAERTILAQEMAKYGRDIEKISQSLKSKTEGEIQAIIDAEYGVILETTSYTQDKFEDNADIPSVGQEEVVTDYNEIKKVVVPATATRHRFRKKIFNHKCKNSLLQSNLNNKIELPETTEIFYEDDMIIGSTESIGSELDMTDIVSKNIAKQQAKVKADKKIGNHRRKVLKNYDKGSRHKDLLKSPQGRQRKDSSLSDDSVKSPKMQIVLGSGQALPVSEGEQVIKIEKKKDSEPESDIEIDVDSDNEGNVSKKAKEVKPANTKAEEPIAVPLRKFEPMPRRQKKINLDGGGGYTIMHTEAGDLYEVGSEPRRERQPKKQPVHLIRCKFYNAERPAPYSVQLHVSTLLQMDLHAHLSRGEVMGLAGGSLRGARLLLSGYRRAAALASRTHCDMEPVSQAAAASLLARAGLCVVGWHHSHPQFPAAPSRQDLRSQRALQAAEWRAPLLAFITSPHWPPGRTASQYCCFRVEDEADSDEPVGYRLPVKLVRDLEDAAAASHLLETLASLHQEPSDDPLQIRLNTDICPHAKITYLEKFISSSAHHLRQAGYADDDPIVLQLIQGIRDIFR